MSSAGNSSQLSVGITFGVVSVVEADVTAVPFVAVQEAYTVYAVSYSNSTLLTWAYVCAVPTLQVADVVCEELVKWKVTSPLEIYSGLSTTQPADAKVPLSEADMLVNPGVGSVAGGVSPPDPLPESQ